MKPRRHKASETRISALTEHQKGHLAWRIDRYTGTGYLTAIRLAKGEFGDKTLFEAFQLTDMNPRRARFHSGKVVRFSLQRKKTKASNNAE